MQASTTPRRARLSINFPFSLPIDPSPHGSEEKLRKVSVFLWHQHHMLGIKFNVETPKCEFSEAAVALRCVDTLKILRQKINETDINIRQTVHMGAECI